MEQLARRVAYWGQQTVWQVGCRAAQLALRKVASLPLPDLGREEIRALRRRYFELLRNDLANAERGYYPQDLLFGIPLAEYGKHLPRLAADLPKMLARMRMNDFATLPADVDVTNYPAYYRRTFHWQTDGYLSEHSAKLYDLGVEFLFGGVADAMRRCALPPLMDLCAERGSGLQILDVACGTGSFLRQLRRAQPSAYLTGLDLSPHYLEFAKQRLLPDARMQLVSGNAEQLPFDDASFDAVVSIFLFHELPRKVRRKVWQEMHRVLRPGGRLVLVDSVQRSDAPELMPSMQRFHRDMHEPFYGDYIGDDLATGLHEQGFALEGPDRAAFLSKVVVAHKRPESPGTELCS